MANKKITDLMSGTPVRDSLLESAIDISGTMDSRKVKAGVIADLASANVAAAYDSATTYAIGQYCLYEGDIYRCIAITTGAFDSTAWVQIVVTGEFRRVVELTSAQYTALSSAEKNNGTLYIITDEETTAADIPYSAGVSVADKLATIDGKLHIEAGRKRASSTQVVRVNFANAYTTPPYVVIVPYNGTSPREYIRSCTVTEITTTYFEFVEQAIDKQLNSFLNGTDDCGWIAYGV